MSRRNSTGHNQSPEECTKRRAYPRSQGAHPRLRQAPIRSPVLAAPLDSQLGRTDRTNSQHEHPREPILTAPLKHAAPSLVSPNAKVPIPMIIHTKALLHHVPQKLNAPFLQDWRRRNVDTSVANRFANFERNLVR